VASAAIESVAENLADSVAAPFLYYVAFGLPGAVVYRVVNTADAMYGYHGDLEWLGKAAARSDDMLSWLPSRMSALALVGAATLLCGPGAGRRALTCWREDGPLTESPNAGRPMAAMAGSLGRRLEKPGHYVLGNGFADPGPADVRTAVELAGIATTLIGLIAIAALLGRRA
jgi:adenosylcobinamide-phosphate synthase